MPPSKNFQCYNGVSEVMEDLRFENLLEDLSFRARNEKEVIIHFTEIDMDSDYEMFWNSVNDHRYISSREPVSFKKVERKRNFKSDSKGVKKVKVTTETVKNSSEYDSIPCKSYGQRSANIDSHSEINESFKVFLASLALGTFGENPEFILKTPDINMNRKDDESSSDLKIISSDDIIEGGYNTPFVPSTLLPSSQFREKLMALVRTPYDQNEFDDLWRKITERKSKQGGRRRECRKIYSTKTKEKSRLDWYPALRMKIDEFRSDQCKVLYLLRGFFFWLQNTAHEDAFMPWLDSLYLNTLGLR